ncbi:MAG: SAM-dependent DNA methyltransferase [Muribaculaceae bacterium]|nr:SAM-dependent DNA methyltransferase [Muribaculaceae bacterium]
MTESKQNLIRLLNATLIEVCNLPEMIEKENIYLEDGFHVDNEFMMVLLQYVNKATEAGLKVMKSLEKLMGIEEDTNQGDSKKSKAGKKWGVQEVLQHCRFENNILYLPDVQLNPKSYAEVKKWIMEAGGKWQGGKTQGFTFDFDATRVTSILLKGERCNLQKDFQFYATPDALADWLVSLSDVKSGYTILEPSAGSGSIIKAVHRVNPDVVVDAFELMPENRQTLEKMTGVKLVGEDFTQGVPCLYNRIFANPPFSGNQDIRHVRAMYEALDPNNGEMCVITSRHWCQASERECEEFRQWLIDVKAEQHEIPRGAFDESGTNVATMALKIAK